MSETVTIIVSPLDWGHTSDSVQITADCGCPSWIAPTGMQQVLNPFFRTRTMCIRHVPRQKLIELFRDGMTSVPGSRTELEAELGVEETERIYKQFNVKEFDGRID